MVSRRDSLKHLVNRRDERKGRGQGTGAKDLPEGRTLMMMMMMMMMMMSSDDDDIDYRLQRVDLARISIAIISLLRWR